MLAHVICMYCTCNVVLLAVRLKVFVTFLSQSCESFGCNFSSFDLDRRFCHMMECSSSYIWALQICCVIIFLDSLMYPLNDWKCEYHCFPLVFLRKMIPSECRSLYFCTFHRTLLIAIFYNRCAVGLYLSFCDSWF